MGKGHPFERRIPHNMNHTNIPQQNRWTTWQGGRKVFYEARFCDRCIEGDRNQERWDIAIEGLEGENA